MKNSSEGLLIIVSGPSGVGKGVICKALMERNSSMRMSVSATTRPPRIGEIDGVNYFFKSSEEFERMIENDEFLEYMRVFGANYYGTPKAYVDEERALGHDIILEIDVKGAMHVKESCPSAVSVFIAPPSMSTLKTRLIGRGTESPEAVERRFAEAFTEMRCIGQYDYLVVNDVLDKAIAAIENIVSAEKMRVSRHPEILKEFEGGMDKK